MRYSTCAVDDWCALRSRFAGENSKRGWRVELDEEIMKERGRARRAS